MFPIPFNFPFRKANGDISTIGAEISGGGGGSSYTLPTASETVKGGVKIGAGLSMEGDTLNNTNPTPATPYTLPTASADTLGGIKVGSGLSIEDGVLSANGGSGGNSLHPHVIIIKQPSATRLRALTFTVYASTTDKIIADSSQWTINQFIRHLMDANNTYASGVIIPCSGYYRSGVEGDFTYITQIEIRYNSGTAGYDFRAYNGVDDTYLDISGNTSYTAPNRPTEMIF